MKKIEIFFPDSMPKERALSMVEFVYSAHVKRSEMSAMKIVVPLSDGTFSVQVQECIEIGGGSSLQFHIEEER